MKIAIATCHNIPEPDVDEVITLQAFRDAGHETDLLAWENGAKAFSDYDVTVIRSTWNYPENLQAFTKWVGEVEHETFLLNPADVVQGNLDKRYLKYITQRGIPIVPTQWVSAKDARYAILELKGDHVLKPTVGAGSWDTYHINPTTVNEIHTWLQTQDDNRMFMIQPFVESVNTVGEQSIIMIGGEPSHRIRKNPRFADGNEAVDGPFRVEPEFEALARKIIEPVRDFILYARVDLMQWEGQWVLGELELVEPSLFFKQMPSALPVFVRETERLAEKS